VAQISSTLFTSKVLLPFYAGVLLVALLVIIIGLNAEIGATRERVYLDRPMVDDRYLVNMRAFFPGSEWPYKYGLLTVSDVSEIGTKFIMNNTPVNEVEPSLSDQSAGNFAQPINAEGESGIFFTNMALADLKKQGAIIIISR
jgi:hypothetical protein